MLLLSDDEAGVVLVDVELAVEAEVFGIRAEEALDVRLGREHIEVLLFQGAEVLASNLRSLFDLGKVEALAQTRLTEAVTDLEQGGSPILGTCELRRKWASPRMLVEHDQPVETNG